VESWVQDILDADTTTGKRKNQGKRVNHMTDKKALAKKGGDAEDLDKVEGEACCDGKTETKDAKKGEDGNSEKEEVKKEMEHPSRLSAP